MAGPGSAEARSACTRGQDLFNADDGDGGRVIYKSLILPDGGNQYLSRNEVAFAD